VRLRKQVLLSQNEAGERLLHARLFYSVTPMAPHLAQFQKDQLQDMLRSASLANEEIADVVDCSTRTVRSACANQQIFEARARRRTLTASTQVALLDHLLTKS
jgi:squalene cyclase